MIPRTTIASIALGLAASTLTACSSSTHSSAHASTSRTVAQLAQRYLAIAEPANKILDKSFDALDDQDDDVAASAALLQTIARTERAFDRDLLALALPPPMDATAAALVRVNEQRADFTERTATVTTVDALRRAEVDLDALNVPVEARVSTLRKQLALPPPDSD